MTIDIFETFSISVACLFKTLNFILQQLHMATNRPQGDLLGWKMDNLTFLGTESH